MICVYRGTGPTDAWLIRDWLVHHGVRAEVRDLKQGYDAIEEHARMQLGMIKRDEVFFQVVRK